MISILKKNISGCKEPKEPLIFVISAPSGTGKSTVANIIEKDLQDSLCRTRSCTTREMRLDEREGHDYYFIDKPSFMRWIEQGRFLEYEEMFGDYYGTLSSEVENILHSGKHVLAVIDVKGACNVKNLYSNVITIFLAPPSTEEQLKRLCGRNSESSVGIKDRLDRGVEEEQMANLFDYRVINYHLSDTCNIIKAIFIAEEHRRRDRG